MILKGRTQLFNKAARDEFQLLGRWLWEPMRKGLEWLLRFGGRPSSATILRVEREGWRRAARADARPSNEV